MQAISLLLDLSVMLLIIIGIVLAWGVWRQETYIEKLIWPYLFLTYVIGAMMVLRRFVWMEE